ncbi:hypothetical protein IW139_003053 [Coemansia sp. RSA 353]|nr:hypothetical protein IW139_003053 [Coemansia sp. RSA 353]
MYAWTRLPRLPKQRQHRAQLLMFSGPAQPAALLDRSAPTVALHMPRVGRDLVLLYAV